MANREFNWDDFLVPYEQTVNELRLKFNQLKKQYEKSGDHSAIHYVSARVKSISSILEKARKYEISLEEISYRLTDLAGVRLVTQFEADILTLTKLISLRSDMRLVMTKDYFNTPKQTGYKAMHLIVEYDVNTIFGVQTVLCEIQLRTLAMDFWASIEHSLNYKYQNEMPGEIRERLISAAAGVIALDSEMGHIREEIQDAQRIFALKSQVINQITEHMNVLSNNGFKDLSRKYYSDFYALREEDNMLQLFLLEKELAQEVSKALNEYERGGT